MQLLVTDGTPMPSGSYILKRALQALGTLFIIVTVLFFLFRLGLPDPTAALVTQGFSPEDRRCCVNGSG